MDTARFRGGCLAALLYSCELSNNNAIAGTEYNGLILNACSGYRITLHITSLQPKRLILLFYKILAHFSNRF